MITQETIVAMITPPGRGGVSIIRLSGKKFYIKKILYKLINVNNKKNKKITIKPRYSYYQNFYDEHNNKIDEGLVLYFPEPHSFTGETILELQVHGSPIVIDQLINYINKLGARLAEPGEFSKRAFLNNKIDLLQAEAIADLINAQTITAARSAQRVLSGEFSKIINNLLNKLINLRINIEALIDFSTEDIDFKSQQELLFLLKNIILEIKNLQKTAQQGRVLNEGLTIVLAGLPNAGKSTLLNRLSGEEIAIVTPIAGTTRDLIKVTLSIDGYLINLIDTAGLRILNKNNNIDLVEKIGIERAYQAIEQADYILWLFENFNELSYLTEFIVLNNNIDINKIILIKTKIDLDLTDNLPEIKDIQLNLLLFKMITLSAKNNLGIDQLIDYLKNQLSNITADGVLLARRRHLIVLEAVLLQLMNCETQWDNLTLDLISENLRLAHQNLSEITGLFTTDDLLSNIFSNFCVGK